LRQVARHDLVGRRIDGIDTLEHAQRGNQPGDQREQKDADDAPDEAVDDDGGEAATLGDVTADHEDQSAVEDHQAYYRVALRWRAVDVVGARALVAEAVYPRVQQHVGRHRVDVAVDALADGIGQIIDPRP